MDLIAYTDSILPILPLNMSVCNLRKNGWSFALTQLVYAVLNYDYGG